MTKSRKYVEIRKIKDEGRFLHHNLLSVSHLHSPQKEKYSYEVIRRRGEDSVAVAIFTEMKGEIYVGLKKVVRIAVLARKLKDEPIVCDLKKSLLLEVVAGSLEDNDRSRKSRAKEEILEEAGFLVKTKEIFSLGKPFFTSPGQSTEKIYPFAVYVDIKSKMEEIGDGSIVEKENERVKFYPFKKIVKMLKRGLIEDAKTEVTLMRLFFKLNLF